DLAGARAERGHLVGALHVRDDDEAVGLEAAPQRRGGVHGAGVREPHGPPPGARGTRVIARSRGTRRHAEKGRGAPPAHGGACRSSSRTSTSASGTAPRPSTSTTGC